MNVCDLITPGTRLQKATKRLQDSWGEAQETWDDSVSRDFQEKYLDPVMPQVQLTLAAIHQLMDTLADAHRECRDQQT